MTAQMGLAMAAANDHGDTTPSVAEGGSSNPLAAAYAWATSDEGQKETAEKHGVTPPLIGAGESEPDDDVEAPEEPEEKALSPPYGSG